MREGEAPERRRTSSFFIAIIIIILFLSITAIYQAINAYSVGANPNEGNYFVMMGVIGLAISAYMLFRTKRGVPRRQTSQKLNVITTIMCEKCAFKKIRSFEQGDYVLKEGEACPKCDNKMIITTIYRELKDKGKNKV